MKKDKEATQVADDLKKYKFFTLADLVDLLGLSKSTLRIFVKTGKLEGTLIAGKFRVSQAALDKFLASTKKAAAEPRADRAARRAKKATGAEKSGEGQAAEK